MLQVRHVEPVVVAHRDHLSLGPVECLDKTWQSVNLENSARRLFTRERNDFHSFTFSLARLGRFRGLSR